MMAMMLNNIPPNDPREQKKSLKIVSSRNENREKKNNTSDKMLYKIVSLSMDRDF